MSIQMMAMHEMSPSESVAFMGMWAAMMSAMMLPVVMPTVLAHHMVCTREGRGMTPSAVFVSGYLVVWFVIGLLPLLVFLALPRLLMQLGATPLVIAGGLLLVAGGVYQLTDLKKACLRHCRHPLEFLMTHDFKAGFVQTFRTGLVHGVYCIGCCWALMLVVLAVGMSNVLWMVLLTAVFLAERWWTGGDRLGRIVAPALMAGGLLLIVGIV